MLCTLARLWIRNSAVYFVKTLKSGMVIGLDPVVTSLQPQLSPHPDAIFFKCQIWTLLITILQRAIVRLCIESRSA